MRTNTGQSCRKALHRGVALNAQECPLAEASADVQINGRNDLPAFDPKRVNVCSNSRMALGSLTVAVQNRSQKRTEEGVHGELNHPTFSR